MENYSEKTINYIITYIQKYVCKEGYLINHLRTKIDNPTAYIKYMIINNMIYVDNHGVLRLDVKTIRKIKLKDFLT